MVEALLAMMPGHLLEYQVSGRLPLPAGNANEAVAPHGCYPCEGEDRWVALSTSSVEEWKSLCDVLALSVFGADSSLENVGARLERRDEIDRAIALKSRQMEAAVLVEQLRAAGVPATVVAQGSDLFADPILNRRGFFEEIETSESGRREIAGRLAKLSFATDPISRGGPKLGEHTSEVLREVLGMEDEEVEALRESGVLR
jgi:benzylsuccinate CoA-transferase BbsF subunit